MMVGIAATVCVPAQAIVLRYAPKVGEVHKQKATIAGRMQTTMEGIGEAVRAEMTGEMEYSEKALSQTDTVTRVQTDLSGGKMSMTMAGQSQSLDMPTGKMVVDMDRQGRVVKLVEMDMPGSEQMMGAAGAENFPNWSQFGAFPEGDVAVNDTWSDKLSMPAGPGMPAIEISYKCTLLDLSTFQGRKCAKIRTTFSGPFEMDLSKMAGVGAGAGGAMNGTMQGDLVWQYDYENSVYVYGEGTVGMDMNMSVGGADMPGGAMTMKMLMNIKTALQP
jgi:hypothetical protein